MTSRTKNQKVKGLNKFQVIFVFDKLIIFGIIA